MKNGGGTTSLFLSEEDLVFQALDDWEHFGKIWVASE